MNDYVEQLSKRDGYFLEYDFDVRGERAERAR